MSAQFHYMKICGNTLSVSVSLGQYKKHYNSDLSIWLSVDPMSDKYPSTSPYTYCANNPVKLVDPNGEEISDNLDWVKDLKTGRYVWMDNVTSPQNTPSGYKYIGPCDDNILTDLNIKSRYSPQQVMTSAFGFIGVVGKGGGLAGAKDILTATLEASVKISYNGSMTNNSQGKVFEGVSFYSTITIGEISTVSSMVNNFNGTLTVSANYQDYPAVFGATKEPYCIPKGMKIKGAEVFVPARSFETTSFRPPQEIFNASISLDSPNPHHISSDNAIKISWGTMLTPILR